MIDSFQYGVCYFPEHWPETAVDDDLSRMRDAGLTYVRVGEGAWAYFEPREGEYRFDLFDRVLDGCQRRGLRVLFGTPTYTGPAWIGHTYPEVYRWNFQRMPMTHGGRRNYTYTSPKYLELCDRITGQLAARYAKAKSVFGWQIDNEFNCHMDVSYSPTDRAAFQQWLLAKYKSIDQLNAAWGTKFWSQTYDAWEQIDLPHPTVAYNNPSQKLDEARFIADTVTAFCKRQADLLRASNPKCRLTHNGLFNHVDGMAVSALLDYWSHDQYPQFYPHWTNAAFGLVQARSLSMPFAIMEQQAGPGGQMDYLHATPRPGQLRLWSCQSVAHGAKIVGYFCWKTCPFGSEQHWHGLIDADGRDTRRLAEAKLLGERLKLLPKEAFDAPVERCIGVLQDYDNNVNEREINSYVKAAWEPGLWTNACGRAHVPADVLWPSSDWAGYRVIVAPHLRIVDARLAAKYDAFVRGGGTLVLGAQSATKDRNLHTVKAVAPGLLRKLAGVEVEDWTNVPAGTTFVAAMAGGPLRLCGFVERIKPRGATVLASWQTEDTLLAGGAAITMNTVGNGRVIYVGGYADATAVTSLLTMILQTAGVVPLVDASDDVEIVARRSGRTRYFWLLNHSPEPHFVEGLPSGRDMIGDADVDGRVKLKGYGVALLQTKT